MCSQGLVVGSIPAGSAKHKSNLDISPSCFFVPKQKNSPNIGEVLENLLQICYITITQYITFLGANNGYKLQKTLETFD